MARWWHENKGMDWPSGWAALEGPHRREDTLKLEGETESASVLGEGHS